MDQKQTSSEKEQQEQIEWQKQVIREEYLKDK